MTEHLLEYLQGIPGELVVFILALMPVVELRAALPVALTVYDFSLLMSWTIVIIGNMVPAFFMLYVWQWIANLIAKWWKPFGEILEKWYAKVQGKWDKKIEKYGPWALVIFVAIPLPGSGVWSGALAAWLFQITPKRALAAIFAGVVLSAFTVTVLTLGIENLITESPFKAG